MIALGIQIGVALVAFTFTFGFLLVVGPVLLACYLLWVNRWRLRLSWQRLCERLIDRLPSYSWDEGAVKEQPVKENDDEADALRYLAKSTERTWRDIYIPEEAA